MKELVFIGLAVGVLYFYKESHHPKLDDHHKIPTGSIVVPKPHYKFTGYRPDANHMFGTIPKHSNIFSRNHSYTERFY